MIKKKFTERLVYLLSALIAIFVVSSTTYFYIYLRMNLNAIGEIAITFYDLIARENVNLHLSNINFIFISQSILFIIVVVCLIAIIIHLTKLFLVQKRNALIDPLTNVYNKRALFFGLKREMKRAERYNHDLTLAILDIDHFKKYNDSNGHARGDEALKKFAQILKEESRETDLVGRYGGEEFLIIFPETNLKEAKKICERIRAKVEATRFYGERKLPSRVLTTSIGVKKYDKRKSKGMPSYSRKMKNLIHQADMKLYQGKTESRNVVKS